MTPSKLALVIKCATAIAQHKGRRCARCDGKGSWTEYGVADPEDFPTIVHCPDCDGSGAVPPIRSGGPFDGRAYPMPDEEYPPEPTQFDREMWREKGC